LDIELLLLLNFSPQVCDLCDYWLNVGFGFFQQLFYLLLVELWRIVLLWSWDILKLLKVGRLGLLNNRHFVLGNLFHLGKLYLSYFSF
jgi:hypothetical protein